MRHKTRGETNVEYKMPNMGDRINNIVNINFADIQSKQKLFM